MHGISDSSAKVSEIISVVAASDEQSSGIEQINRAVTQMDDVTQQNAALVEQASAAAHSMAQQAHDLLGVVAVFKIDGMRQALY
jgi:methyl-accepting chemotaxis protein-1 (serine sensor receptor)